ncbi:MAG: S4 domain-containing protein YaaA [Erysipelotrichaceae bacterium]|nr:S4 domain-containing protein YaaA [Erysipelotrichaceae bacterium]
MKEVIVQINSDYITLGQLLKKEDLIQTGGEAKFYLHSQEVLVNGEKEDRRGRKLYSGDVVTAEGQDYKIL